MSSRQRNSTILYRILPAIVILFVLGIWQIVAVIGIFQPSLFPSPGRVFLAIIELGQKGVLFQHIFDSLLRVFSGFLIASVLAMPLGFLMGQYPLLQHAINPLAQIFRPISPIAWIPLAILWFGIGNWPAIFIITLATFFPILLAAVSAVKQVDVNIIKAAVNLGASRRDILLKVIVPATFPPMIVGLRTALGIAWVIIVAAEMVGMRSGLGYMILDARNFLRADMVVAGMVIIGLVGLILDRIMVYIEQVVSRRWGVLLEY